MKEYRLMPRDLDLLYSLTKMGPDTYIPSSNYHAVHSVRKVLGKENILTANGVGYRVTDEGRRRAKEMLRNILQHE